MTHVYPQYILMGQGYSCETHRNGKKDLIEVMINNKLVSCGKKNIKYLSFPNICSKNVTIPFITSSNLWAHKKNN